MNSITERDLGANALIYEKRKDAIMTLIDDEILSRKNYADLTRTIKGRILILSHREPGSTMRSSTVGV